MNMSTATGAKEKNTYTITFKDQEHKDFYNTYLAKCREQDEYHKALVYCLGLSEDTRRCADQIYDFKTGYIRTECLGEEWITSGSSRIVRMAFNLYCNGTPSVGDYDNAEDQMKECQCYTVEDLFCCDYAPFFWEAVKLRYPGYACKV